MSEPTGFQVRAGASGRPVAHEGEYTSLADALLAATRHLAANPGHVAVLHERADGGVGRTHEIHPHQGVLIDPEPWSALVHLEWEGATVEVAPLEGGGARVRIARGEREVVADAAAGTAAAEEALRRWGGSG